jgi:hypothetical protein
MLHYSKMILEKMSIDKHLFRKELKKAYEKLSPEDAIELYYWGIKRYPDLILEQPPVLIRA